MSSAKKQVPNNASVELLRRQLAAAKQRELEAIEARQDFESGLRQRAEDAECELEDMRASVARLAAIISNALGRETLEDSTDRYDAFRAIEDLRAL